VVVVDGPHGHGGDVVVLVVVVVGVLGQHQLVVALLLLPRTRGGEGEREPGREPGGERARERESQWETVRGLGLEREDRGNDSYSYSSRTRSIARTRSFWACWKALSSARRNVSTW
jgi:hypothetical protein